MLKEFNSTSLNKQKGFYSAGKQMSHFFKMLNYCFKNAEA